MAVSTKRTQSPRLTDDHLKEALRLMLTIRHFDEQAMALYRAGEMRGTTHPYIGMEAVGVGVMMALQATDCVTSRYAMSARADWTVAGGQPSTRAAGYGIPGVDVDGMDFFAVNNAASDLVDRARRGEGPSYLVCLTYRYHGHHAGDPLNYRDREEVERWRQQDPIERVKNAAIERGVMTAAEIATLEQRVQAEIDAAVEFAKSSPEPTVDQLM